MCTYTGDRTVSDYTGSAACTDSGVRVDGNRQGLGGTWVGTLWAHNETDGEADDSLA